jgi:hypothetical protein
LDELFIDQASWVMHVLLLDSERLSVAFSVDMSWFRAVCEVAWIVKAGIGGFIGTNMLLREIPGTA